MGGAICICICVWCCGGGAAGFWSGSELSEPFALVLGGGDCAFRSSSGELAANGGFGGPAVPSDVWMLRLAAGRPDGGGCGGGGAFFDFDLKRNDMVHGVLSAGTCARSVAKGSVAVLCVRRMLVGCAGHIIQLHALARPSMPSSFYWVVSLCRRLSLRWSACTKDWGWAATTA